MKYIVDKRFTETLERSSDRVVVPAKTPNLIVQDRPSVPLVAERRPAPVVPKRNPSTTVAEKSSILIPAEQIPPPIVSEQQPALSIAEKSPVSVASPIDKSLNVKLDMNSEKRFEELKEPEEELTKRQQQAYSHLKLVHDEDEDEDDESDDEDFDEYGQHVNPPNIKQFNIRQANLKSAIIRPVVIRSTNNNNKGDNIAASSISSNVLPKGNNVINKALNSSGHQQQTPDVKLGDQNSKVQIEKDDVQSVPSQPSTERPDEPADRTFSGTQLTSNDIPLIDDTTEQEAADHEAQSRPALKHKVGVIAGDIETNRERRQRYLNELQKDLNLQKPTPVIKSIGDKWLEDFQKKAGIDEDVKVAKLRESREKENVSANLTKSKEPTKKIFDTVTKDDNSVIPKGKYCLVPADSQVDMKSDKDSDLHGIAAEGPVGYKPLVTPNSADKNITLDFKDRNLSIIESDAKLNAAKNEQTLGSVNEPLESKVNEKLGSVEIGKSVILAKDVDVVARSDTAIKNVKTASPTTSQASDTSRSAITALENAERGVASKSGVVERKEQPVVERITPQEGKERMKSAAVTPDKEGAHDTVEIRSHSRDRVRVNIILYPFIWKTESYYNNKLKLF